MAAAQATAIDGLVETVLVGLQFGMPIIQEQLKGLLRPLVAIELILGAFAYAGAHLGVFAHAMTAVLKTVVFVFLLTALPYVTTAFIDYCIYGGLTLAGAGAHISVDDFKRPSTVLMKGFEATKPINTWANKFTGWGMMKNLFTVLMVAGASLLIFFVFTLLALHVVWLLLTTYVAAAYAVLLVPFGVLGPLSFLAQRGIAMTIEGALRLGLAALITSLVFPFVEQFFLTNGVEQNIDIAAAFWLFVGALVSLLLTVGIPATVKSVSGMPLGGTLGMMFPNASVFTGFGGSGGSGGGRSGGDSVTGSSGRGTGGASPPRHPQVERTTAPGYEFY